LEFKHFAGGVELDTKQSRQPAVTSEPRSPLPGARPSDLAMAYPERQDSSESCSFSIRTFKPTTDSSDILKACIQMQRKAFPKLEVQDLAALAQKRGTVLLLALLPLVGDGTAMPMRRQGVHSAVRVAGFLMFTHTSAAYIAKLVVCKAQRNKGAGGLLLDTALSKMRKARILACTLHVDQSRTVAMNLYRSRGFKQDRLLRGYYGPGRDAWRMELDFLAEREAQYQRDAAA